MPGQSGSVQNDSVDRVALFVLGIAIASWIGLMIPFLTAGPLVLDEHCSYWLIDADQPGTTLERSLNYAAIPPLSAWVQQATLAICGKSEWAFRLPSAVMGLLAVLGCYVVGKDQFDARVGALAALLMAWHPEAMDEVRIARCYGQVLLLAVVVTGAALRWSREPLSWRWTALHVVASVALVWTHYTAVLLVAFSWLTMVTVAWLGTPAKRPLFGRIAVSLVLISAGIWPLHASITRLQEWGPLLNFGPAGGAPLTSVIGPFWWAAFPAGWGMAALGHWWLTRGSQATNTGAQLPAARHDLLILIACGLAPLAVLAEMSLGETSSLANPRYRIAVAPAGCLLIAWCLNHPLVLTGLWRQGRTLPARRLVERPQPFVLLVSGLAVLVVAWSCSALRPWQPGRLGMPADQEWGELNAIISRDSQAGEPLVVLSGLTEGFILPLMRDDLQFQEYVACRVSRFYVESQHPRIALPFLWHEELGTAAHYRRQLERWRSTTGCFWLAAATDTDLNRSAVARFEQLAAEAAFRPELTVERSQCRLTRYRTTTDR